MKINIITLTGLTASDGSVIASGATMKFDSEFLAASTNIKITPRLYRNKELFETGYDSIQIPEELIPYDFILQVSDEEFYVIIKNNNLEIKDFFNAAYGVLINKQKGPKLASFVLSIGRQKVGELFGKV